MFAELSTAQQKCGQRFGVSPPLLVAHMGAIASAPVELVRPSPKSSFCWGMVPREKNADCPRREKRNWKAARDVADWSPIVLEKPI